ncbi:MAG: hypothetical protein IJY23_07585 [Clostridia bacterium]|nr:hypothetical protein [Clostridia bacterium]
MKSIYFFCTKPWVYLTELPVLFMLWVAMIFNGQSEEVFKFYPLIIVLSAAVIFIFVYFFRVISISIDEIRYHGLFSSRDSAFIDENKTLLISLKPRLRLGLELYGDAGDVPAFDWMKAEDVKHRDICLFRGKAIGGKRSAARILNFFSVPKEEIVKATNDGFFYEDDALLVKSERKNEVFQISIQFKTTLT